MKLKSFLVVLVLFFAVQAIAQAPQTGAPAQQPAGAQAPAAGAQPQAAQKKQITNIEEYNMYAAALKETDPAKRAAALDAFLKKYPSTPVKEDALEAKMSAEAAAGQAAAAAQTARELVQVNPRNVAALNVLVSVFVQNPPQPSDPQKEQKLTEAEQWAKTGLEALPSFAPPGVNPEQLEAAKKETAALFHQALGLVASLRANYAGAQQEYLQAAQLNPNNALYFYQLGSVYIAERPEPKYSPGFYALARAAAYTGTGALPPQTRQAIEKYLTDNYVKYHGSPQGLAELKQQAGTQPFPPADFHIMSASEVAAAAPPEPDKMDFTEIRDMLLSNTPKSEQLWNMLKGTTRKFPGLVVSATPAARPKTVRLAVTQETAKKGDDSYDVELVLAAPVPASRVPVGKIVDFSGVVNAFNKQPFSLVMIDGKIEGGEEAAPAAKKPPAAKKGGAKKRG